MNYLLFLLTSLQLTDGVMTDILVKLNLVKEGNSLMAPLVENGSFLLLKLVGIAACILALKLLSRRYKMLAFITGTAAAVFYFGVIVWNVGVLV